MSAQSFGQLPDGREVHLVRLKNEQMQLGLITLGASLQSVTFGDQSVLLGSDHLDDYLGPMTYFGAIVGRVANRIAKACATIDGQHFSFDANEANGNCLHGGSDGAGVQLWALSDVGETHAVFELALPDGHMGFPGNLDVTARYDLKGSEIRLQIFARSDATTLCSFAPHGYWNLSGEPTIHTHALKIAATEYLPLDENSIPLGEIARVEGTALNFAKKRLIKDAALDHNFCVGNRHENLRPVCWLTSEASDISLEVASTEPGLQIYDARHCDRSGLAIEPQIWPDAVNHANFPSMILRPTETYEAITVFRLLKGPHP